MAYPASKRKRFQVAFFKELNIIPVLNIFLIIIPFLIFSVVMSRLVSLNIRLPEPKDGETKKVETTEEKEKKPNLIMKINHDSLTFTFDKKDVAKFPSELLANDNNLATVIDSIVKEYPDYRGFVISPNDSIHYSVVVQLMGITKFNGIKKVSLSY